MKPETAADANRAEVWRLLSVCFCQPDGAARDADVPARLRTALAGFGPRCAEAGDRLEQESGKTSLEEQLVEYSRLFVGPFALRAPPYASVYLDPEGQVAGASTHAVELMYAEAGQGVDPDQHEPADHVALELEFLGFLEITVAGMDAGGPQARRQGTQELYDRFLSHARSWMPEFCARIRASSEGGFFATLADCLESTLQVTAHRKVSRLTSGGQNQRRRGA